MLLDEYDRSARYMLRERIARRGETPDPRLWEPSESWNAVEDMVSPEDYEWLYTKGVHEGLFRYGDVTGGAIYGVQDLNKLGDVVLVTTRPKQAVHDTLVWVSTMFDQAPLAGIHILSHGQPKSSVLPEPNIFIDDATHNLDDIHTNTRPHVNAVLFDRPWNQSYDPEPKYRRRWRRARGWAQVVKAVTDAKEGKW